MRHMRRFCVRTLCAAVGLLTVGVLPPAPSASAGELAKLFPANTLLLVEWSGLPAQQAALSKTALHEFYADPEVQKFTRVELPKLIEQLKSKLGGSLPPGVLDKHLSALTMLRDRPMAFAWFGLTLPKNDEVPSPELALVVDLGDANRKAAFVEWLAMVEKDLLTQVPPDAVETRAPGVKQLNTPVGITVNWGVRDQLFAITVGPKAAGILLDPKWAPAKPLTGDATYARAVQEAKLDKAAMSLYVNTDPLFKEFLPAIKEREDLKPLIEEFERQLQLSYGPNGIEMLAASMCVEDRGFRTRSIMTGGFTKLQKPLTAADLKVAPADAAFVSASTIDILGLYDQQMANLKASLEKSGQWEFLEGIIKEFEAGLGLKIRDDLLAPLSGSFVLFDGPPQVPVLGGFTLVVGLKDAAKLKAALAKLVKIANEKLVELPAGPRSLRFKLHTRTVPTGEQFYMPLVVAAPTIHLTEKYAIVTLFPQAAEEVATRLADPKAPTILDNRAFAKATAGVPMDNVSQLHYSQSIAGLKSLHSSVLLLSRLAAGLSPNINVELDFASLPPGSLLADRMFPTVGYTTTRDGVLYSESYCALPFGELIPFVAVGAGLGAAAALGSMFQNEAAPGFGNGPPVLPVPVPQPKRVVEKKEFEKKE